MKDSVVIQPTEEETEDPESSSRLVQGFTAMGVEATFKDWQGGSKVHISTGGWVGH